ncbi:MAG: HIT family protein [Phycisphaerae bacterium]
MARIVRPAVQEEGQAMSVDTECVFCKIVSGQIPACKILDTDSAIAFLDIGPLADGHLLLIPKTHYGRIDEMPADQAAGLAELLPRLGRVLVQVTGADGFNVLQNNGPVAGQVVPHVHIHLIPRTADDGLGYRWNAGSYAPGQADELADRFRQALQG